MGGALPAGDAAREAQDAWRHQLRFVVWWSVGQSM